MLFRRFTPGKMFIDSFEGFFEILALDFVCFQEVVDVKGVKLVATGLKGVDMNGLRDLGDQTKAKIGECVVVLFSELDGKVNIVAMATDGAVKAGAHAGNLIKALAPICGGGGGGRPNMAQAGGKDPSGIEKAVAEAAKVLESQIA